MRITIHSHQNLFTPQLSKYCEEKLSKPVTRHHIDSEATRLDVDGENAGDKVEIRVRLGLPHHNPITVHVQHGDAYAAVDLAADKLERQLRDMMDKRASTTKKGKTVPTAALGAEDFFTEDEESTLREMGALDAVIEA
jgi:putative sigma-54 modulation protein